MRLYHKMLGRVHDDPYKVVVCDPSIAIQHSYKLLCDAKASTNGHFLLHALQLMHSTLCYGTQGGVEQSLYLLALNLVPEGQRDEQ
jgi:hypothetical protein